MKKLILLLCAMTCIFCTNVYANEEYEIPWIDLLTLTINDNPTETLIWFNIVKNGEDLTENFVETVTVTAPDGSIFSPPPAYYDWWRVEFRAKDENRNGTIDLDSGEYHGSIVKYGIEYEIKTRTPHSPHLAGEYNLEIKCKDGAVLTKSVNVDKGLTPVEVPLVTNIVGKFDEKSELLNIAWELPTSYPEDYSIELRIERFTDSRQKGYIRYRVQNLLPTTTNYNFFKWESKAIMHFAPYIQVKVSIKSADGSSNIQATQDYKIEGNDLIPIDLSSNEEPSTCVKLDSAFNMKIPCAYIEEDSLFKFDLNSIPDSASPLGVHWEIDMESLNVK